MNADEYLQSRVEDQIAWYDRKAQASKRGFVVCQIITLAASATVPVVAIVSGAIWSRVVVAVLGSTIAVAAGIVALFQFREHWIEYRTTAESLKHEKYMFQTQTAPYSEDDSFSLFVERVEALVSQENTAWQQRLTTQRKDGKAHG